jgi:hypothetical protein
MGAAETRRRRWRLTGRGRLPSKIFRLIFCFRFAGLVRVEKANARNVILDWNASASQTAIGCCVYYGTTRLFQFTVPPLGIALSTNGKVSAALFF